MELPWPPTDGTGRVVDLALVPLEQLAAAWSGTTDGPTWDSVFPGGRRVTGERGVAGDQLIRYADEQAPFLISPDAGRIACAALAPEDRSWQRFLYDTVLWWTALANGMHV